MNGTATTVYGIFYDEGMVNRARERLLAAGVREEDISVKNPGLLGTKDLADTRDSAAGSSTAVVTSSVAIGGTLGLAAGVGAMAIPGVGPLLAAGPFLGALAGFGAGGAIGGAVDAIDSAGLPDPGIKRYEGHIAEGGILLSIHCREPAEATHVTTLLREIGAQAISTLERAGSE